MSVSATPHSVMSNITIIIKLIIIINFLSLLQLKENFPSKEFLTHAGVVNIDLGVKI